MGNYSRKAAIAFVLAGLLFVAASIILAGGYFRALPRGGVARTANVEAIADWMTLRYVSRAYGVPEDVLLSSLGLSSTEAQHRSLAQIARLKRQSSDQIVATVRATVVQYRSTHRGEAPPTRPPSGR